MAWEKGRVRDGDPIYHVTKWRRELERTSKRTKGSLEERSNALKMLKEDEVMMKHPTSGALIRLTDDGNIEMMTEGAGIRLTAEGIDILGERLVVSTKEMHVMNEKRGLLDGERAVKTQRENTKEEIKRWKEVRNDVD